jgi:hypothetical protein
MRRSRRMWASPQARPTSPAVAAFPLDRFDKPREEAVVKAKSRDALTADQRGEQDAEELAERPAMSLVAANLAVPVNAAAALNVLNDHSTAVADAEQSADIHQSR